MGMHEITERTTVKESDGTEKVLLPGRITQAEAEQYGLAAVQADVKTTHEAPAVKARKKA